MSLNRKMLSGGALVGIGQLSTMALMFVRNMVVARTVSLEDMGIASTIALALTVVESASEMNVQQFIVQSKAGDDPLLQSNAQSFTVIRGFITAVVLMLAGGPLAHLFRVPQAAWAFRLMAAAPILRGFAHLDVWRSHREMRFGPLVRVELISQVVATIAVWPLSLLVANYSIMLWVLLIQAAVMTLLSHLGAERRYSLALRWSCLSQLFAFGWPLMINCLLLLVLNFGDRFVIAAFPAYTKSDVGLYMVASLVTQMPTALVSKLSNTILLPALARAQDDRAAFLEKLHVITTMGGIIALVQTLMLIVAGPSLVVLCFSEKYLPVAAFFAWLAAVSGVRILRLSPTVAALALGDSKIAMLSSFSRTIGFVFVIIAASSGAGLHWFAISACLGELVSYFVALYLLQRRNSIFVSSSLVVCGLLSFTAALAMGLFELVRGPDVMWVVPSSVALGAAILAITLYVWFSATVRKHINEVFGHHVRGWVGVCK